jgi:hypothetical protein
LLQAKANTELRDADGARPIELARAMLAAPSEFDDPVVLEEMIKLLQVA